MSSELQVRRFAFERIRLALICSMHFTLSHVSQCHHSMYTECADCHLSLRKLKSVLFRNLNPEIAPRVTIGLQIKFNLLKV